MPANRKPTVVLERAGAFQKDPKRGKDRANEPKPKAGLGNPPRHLTKNQKAAWREIVKHAPNGVFGDSDRIAVEMASVLLAEIRFDMRAGIFVDLKLYQRLESLLGKFGYTPADRSRVSGSGGEKPKSGWDDL